MVRVVFDVSKFSQIMSDGSGADTTVMGTLDGPNRNGVGYKHITTRQGKGAMTFPRRQQTPVTSADGISYLRNQLPPAL